MSDKLLATDHAAGKTPIETEEEEAEESTRRKMDPELRTMASMIRDLDDLEPEARNRVVAYLASRYKGQPNA